MLNISESIKSQEKADIWEINNESSPHSHTNISDNNTDISTRDCLMTDIAGPEIEY